MGADDPRMSPRRLSPTPDARALAEDARLANVIAQGRNVLLLGPTRAWLQVLRPKLRKISDRTVITIDAAKLHNDAAIANHIARTSAHRSNSRAHNLQSFMDTLDPITALMHSLHALQPGTLRTQRLSTPVTLVWLHAERMLRRREPERRVSTIRGVAEFQRDVAYVFIANVSHQRASALMTGYEAPFYGQLEEFSFDSSAGLRRRVRRPPTSATLADD